MINLLSALSIATAFGIVAGVIVAIADWLVEADRERLTPRQAMLHSLWVLGICTVWWVAVPLLTFRLLARNTWRKS